MHDLLLLDNVGISVKNIYDTFEIVKNNYKASPHYITCNMPKRHHYICELGFAELVEVHLSVRLNKNIVHDWNIR